MKFKFRDEPLPTFVKYIEEHYNDAALLVFSRYQIADDNPQATGIRITIGKLVKLLGDERVQKIIEEIIDYGSYMFSTQDMKDLKLDECSYPFTDHDRENLIGFLQ